MPRISRVKSSSGYYHIILRGVNRQDIFFDDKDREKMLDTLKRFQGECDVRIIAYCLMSNHIHLLVKAMDGLSLFIGKIASSYVYYFNHKYDRVGHLFQGRYKSEAIDTATYLLTVFRYILQNPKKAGICAPDAYPWSSWKSLERAEERKNSGENRREIKRENKQDNKQEIKRENKQENKWEDELCDDDGIHLIASIAGGRQALKEYVLQQNSDQGLEAETGHVMTEKDVIRKALSVTGGENPLKIAQYPKEERDLLLVRLKEAGLSVRQISRLTGLNRNTVQRAQVNESRDLSL